MEAGGESSNTAIAIAAAAADQVAEEEEVIETLRARGWRFVNLNQLRALITIHSALFDGDDASSMAGSIESELLNSDLRSMGAAKSLPDRNQKPSHLIGPLVLQVSLARDISLGSGAEGFSDSGRKRLLKLVLTDGHGEITAIEYSHIPAIPNEVVPGTKIRLENKVTIHNGIVCLNRKAITLLGGVVQSLYDEWEMNRKYSGISRSLKVSQDADGGGSGGPPRFEKLQVGAPFRRPSQRGGVSEYTESSSRSTPAATPQTARNEETGPIGVKQKVDNNDDKMKTASATENVKQRPSTSETRLKKVVDSAPVQNQAAAQKLLQKMISDNHANQRSRGRRRRGKGKQEDHQWLTLEEWENSKSGVEVPARSMVPDTSHDEYLAQQLQNQLDIEDSLAPKGAHNTVEDDIRMSMFSYNRDGDGIRGTEYGGRGRGKGRGRGQGRGRGRGRGRGSF